MARDVFAADVQRARRHVLHAQQRVDEGRFSRAGRSDDGQGSARRQRERHAIEQAPPSRWQCRGRALRWRVRPASLAPPFRRRPIAGRGRGRALQVADAGTRGEQLLYPYPARQPPLPDADDPAERHGGPRKQDEVGVEGHQAPDRQSPADHLTPACPQHHQGAEAAQPGEERHQGPRDAHHAPTSGAGTRRSRSGSSPRATLPACSS